MRASWLRKAASVGLGASVALSLCAGCECSSDDAPSPSASASAKPGELSPELAERVLAKVGDRTITLGDYAATLRRMDQFERIRYQSEDRRNKLLEEIINVELLAREAERRGLGDSPKAKDLLRRMLRDELLRLERDKLPELDELPDTEVRAYYERHTEEFRDPERRRVGHIVVAKKELAEKLLSEARQASPAAWGNLVRSHSLDAKAKVGDKTDSLPPLELAGDLGLVSAPGENRGQNPDVPEPVRRAVFQLEKVGDVFSEVVAHEGRFHIVRLMGKSRARTRTFEEAERAIRMKLLAERIEQNERELLAQLKSKIPVQINEAALDQVRASSPASSAAASPAVSPTGAASAGAPQASP